jgi:5-methylcytosine-specific restriction protein A
MATRQFRTDASVASEARTRDAIVPLLNRHGFEVLADERTVRGTATTQVITAKRGKGDPVKLHVRLCWRRDGRNAREDSYSAAQLRASLIEDSWEKTLAFVADRARAAGNDFALFVQDAADGVVFAAMVPSDQIPAIWQRQREVSANIIERGDTGRWRKNHAENGSSPTIWLQDDRWPTAHAVADALWQWPGVVNILALPALSESAASLDSVDDLPADRALLGRDIGERLVSIKSGYPRDPKVRAAVLVRAEGRCEREECGEQRPYPGFLDVHHILGVGVSDRAWTCVAICPNCHREAHFAPDQSAINVRLMEYAKQFAD